MAITAAERQKIHDHVNQHMDDPHNVNPFPPANLHQIQLNHPAPRTAGPVPLKHQTYAGFLPMHPDHVSGAMPSHMAAYAQAVHKRLDAATGGQDPSMVVTTHHTPHDDQFLFHTQPRGRHENNALQKAKERATDVFSDIGDAYKHHNKPLVPHAEPAGSMAYALHRHAECSEDYNPALGHGYTIGAAGRNWSGPSAMCHKVLGTTTQGSYQTMDMPLPNEAGRIVTYDDQYRGPHY